MTVNEAPRLTSRVVAMLMLVVFVLCLLADQLQCSKNGNKSPCTGPVPYTCSGSYCRGEVETPTSISHDTGCQFRGTAEVLFAIVEVGPSIVSARGHNVSTYMAEELRGWVEAKQFPRDAEAGTPNDPTAIPTPRVVDDYNEIFSKLSVLKRNPRKSTRYSVSSDTIPLPAYRANEEAAYTTWKEAVEAVLPTSSVDDPKQLPRYFPNLYAMLEAATARKKKSSTTASECDTIQLIVYVVTSPLASIRQIWDRDVNTGEVQREGRTYIHGAVTRYIQTNKRVLKHLQGVQYMHLYLAPPARRFTLATWANSMKRSYFGRETRTTPEVKETPLSAENVVGAKEIDVSAALAFCNRTSDAAMPTCGSACENYVAYSAAAARVELAIGSSYHSFNGYFSGRPDANVAFSHVSNCYFDILRTSNGAAPVNGTFGADAEAAMFDDCLHLSPAGGKAFASCLLNMRTRRGDPVWH